MVYIYFRNNANKCYQISREPHKMPTEQLADLTQPQRDRLAFFELRVRFIGEIHRQDLVKRFEIQSAAATKYLALYKELAPGNINYDSKGKSYVLGPNFQPVSNFPVERVLSWRIQSFGDGEQIRLRALGASETPSRLTYPDPDVLATVTRAIHQECIPVRRIPHNFERPHRAGDRPFRADQQRAPLTCQGVRPQVSGVWRLHHHPDHGPTGATGFFGRASRVQRLDLVPHPDQPRPEITEMDYGMQNGALSMKLRAANADYVLREWNVDSPPDDSLRGPEYRLWLKVHLAMHSVKNPILAPGYRAPDQQNIELEVD